MYPYDDPSGVATRPPVTAANAQSYRTDGNPVANLLASLAKGEWFNAFDDEMVNIHSAAGVALSKSVFTTLLSSLLVLSGGSLFALMDTSAVANAMVAQAQIQAPNPAPGSVVPIIPAYKNGMLATITPAITNVAGAVMLNINGIGAIPVLRSDGSAPVAGDLPAGKPRLIYCTGAAWLLLAPVPSQWLVSPALTGNPTAPTPAANDNSTKIATTAFVAAFVQSALPVQAPFGGPENAIAGAAHTYAAADANKAAWRSNGGAAMIDLLPGATAGALAANWSASVINADPSALLAIQVGAGSTLKGPGVAGGMLCLGPGQMATVFCDGTNYEAWGSPKRAALAANTTIFVSTSGSDTTGAGIASTSPFATLAHAYQWAQSSLDLAGSQLTIALASGQYANTVTFLAGLLTGQTSPVIVSGATNGTTTISVLSIGNGGTLGGGQVEIQNLTIVNSVGGVGSLIAQTAGSLAIVGAGVTFGASVGSHIVAWEGGQVVLLASYTISGNATGSHWNAFGLGSIVYRSGTYVVTLANGISFGTFATSAVNAVITMDSVNLTFSGTATGTRYNASAGAVINTNGGPPTFLPGSTAGTVSGGTYQ